MINALNKAKAVLEGLCCCECKEQGAGMASVCCRDVDCMAGYNGINADEVKAALEAIDTSLGLRVQTGGTIPLPSVECGKSGSKPYGCKEGACVFSRSMDQEYPRKCIKCGATEKTSAECDHEWLTNNELSMTLWKCRKCGETKTETSVERPTQETECPDCKWRTHTKEFQPCIDCEDRSEFKAETSDQSPKEAPNND